MLRAMAGERVRGTSVALATLLERLPDAQIDGDRKRLVTGIEVDSHAVRPGSLFVALRGSHVDGHLFVPQAIADGAAALLVDAEHSLATPPGVTVVRVSDTRRALSAVSAAFYQDPSRSLDVIGITGTNGKTTVSRMIAAILNEGGIPCGVIGTVGAEFRAQTWQLRNTTPLPPELHGLLACMRADGARAVAMEVSSHALALERVEDVAFSIAVLTNVTRDHLDFHETLDAYSAAKRRLFELAPACVMNLDDSYGARWAVDAAAAGREVISYGVSSCAMLVPTEIVVAADHSRFTVNDQRYELRLPGRFNIWNALAAIGVARSLGIADAASERGLAALERVPGRMEHFKVNGIDVVIDYAHTPDALENALRSLRETAKGTLAVVFGCGGDRDKGKRSQMGAVAAQLADRIYLTNDNPRTEEPGAIVEAIAAGIGSHAYVVELDRRQAIERAIAESQPGDVVLIAGKGHETYQIVGERVLPFDDATIAREALSARGVLR
jgi:UDP-N-acetylmuramoyl-L-alanyl-D-glutamate--2,6-diaminopimelate ligase